MICKHSCFLLLALLLVIHCTGYDRIAGAGTETTNSLTGSVVNVGGMVAPNTIVELLPDTYDIVKNGISGQLLIDTTDILGRYFFDNLTPGSYTLQARSAHNRTRALSHGIAVATDTTNNAIMTIRTTGSLKIALPGGSVESGSYVYVPGTSIVAYTVPDELSVSFTSVPACTIPAILYATPAKTTPTVLRYNVIVQPSDTATVYHTDWERSTEIVLNTSATGAGVNGTVVHFPVLVRLTNDNFDFSQTLAGGADIRFTRSDSTFLPCEIEYWDATLGQAAIWVCVDTISGNDSSQSITMYWGNESATTLTSSYPVFDTAQGFEGVWHLSEAGNTTAFDATANNYDGTPGGMSATSSVQGIAGRAMDFDGLSSSITMANTANSKLNFGENGVYWMSAWVYADTIDNIWHGIASKGHEQYFLQYKCFEGLKASWEFVEYKGGTGWEYSEDSIPSSPGAKAWVHLTGVRDSLRQYLFINGALVKDSFLLNDDTIPRQTGDDFTIGKHTRVVFQPSTLGWGYFDGKIDEVRVGRGRISADWIRLCYMNQQQDDKLVVIRR